MAFSRVHNFVTAIADSGDATLLQPSNWNEAHNVSGADVGGIPYCPTATTETTSANLTYDETSGPRLQAGSGATTEVGMTIGYTGTSGLGGMWHSAQSSKIFSTALVYSNATYISVNAPIANGGVYIAEAGTQKGVFGLGAGRGLYLTAGTANTDVNALSITQTMNAAAVAFTGSKWTFTEGASGTAAGTLLFDILYGTSGAEASKFKVSKAGAATAVQFTPAAGTTTIAPIVLTSGTNLTTPAAGAQEYDGSVFYKTPVASNRAVDDIEHFITQTANRTLTDQAALQACFDAVTNGTITLPAATGYYFEWLVLGTNTGATSHQWQLGFGGTATLTSISYASYGSTATSAGGLTNVAGGHATAATAYSVTTASTSTTENVRIRATGKIYINAAGTLIPQIGFSAQPNGTETVLAGSFFRMWPIGSNSVASVGNWS